MRLTAILLALFLFSGFFFKETHQFTFPKLDLTKLEQDLKSAGKKIIDKFSFVKWVVGKITSLTNTKKDLTGMVTDAVDKYWERKRLTHLNVEDIDEQEPEFTRHLQAEIDNFQDYLIKIYQIDTKDSDFIRHIKSDPDRFFLNYDAYQLLKGMSTDPSHYRRQHIPSRTTSVNEEL